MEAESCQVLQPREDVFEAECDTGLTVPFYVLLESVFQTAGRLAREVTHNRHGAGIVSFSNFVFARPVFQDEQVTYYAKLLSVNEEKRSFFFRITISAEGQLIVPDGRLITKQEDVISTHSLNNNIRLSAEDGMNLLRLKRGRSVWIWIFNIVMMSLFLVPGFLAVYFILERQRSRRTIAAKPPYHPKVTVLLPFRGLDYNFEATLRSLASQQYAGSYEVLAVTSEENGRGEELVHQYAALSPRIHLVKASHSEVSRHRSDKVNNLLTGIAHASKDTEVYVFIDSDIVPQPSWIEQMVQPLQSAQVGLTSGSAWIVSKSRSVLALAARYWDFLATTMITFPVTRFARGFSFGIRKNVFEQIGMKSIWSEAFHDNFTISDVVRRAGFRIQYVPDCLVPEHFDIQGFAWVKWVKRQALNTKVNYKRLWAFGFFLVTMPRLLGAVLFLVALGFRITGDVPSLLYIFLYWPLLHIAGAALVVAAVSRDASQIKDYRPSFIRVAVLVLASFVSVVYCISSLWAVISNKMEWRNLVYHQKTPFTTVVTGEKGRKQDAGQ